MLYEAERHEQLTASTWNEQAAQACIDEILCDADRQVLGSRPLAVSSARQFFASCPLEPLYRRGRHDVGAVPSKPKPGGPTRFHRRRAAAA